MPFLRSRGILISALSLLAASLAACGSSGSGSTGSTAAAPPEQLRLGYLPNLTHAPALIGVQDGFFQKELGSATTLKTQTFNAGPAAIEALFAGSLDASFVGPNPAINGFIQSHGDALRVVAGATLGGAGLVVQPDEHVTSATDLKGKHVATPQLGNTQDVALRNWLSAAGLHTDPQTGGDVLISPTDNATTLSLFQQHKIDAAWVPEPYLSRLLIEDRGTLLVDEASLWPHGQFPTTLLVVATSFLHEHPNTVESLIQGEADALDLIASDPVRAKADANASLKTLTQKALSTRVLDAAWQRLSFSLDPDAASLQREASNANSVGLLSTTNLKGILDAAVVDAVLAKAGKPALDTAGLTA